MQKTAYVYIMTNRLRTTLYIGVTSNLQRRVEEHKNGTFDGFSKKYSLHYLMYYEQYDQMIDAIKREKQLKKWNRAWKDELIDTVNPKRKDLSAEWFGEA